VSDDGASPTPPPDDAAPPRPENPWMDRTRFARLVALAGVLAIVLIARSLVMPHLPTDHDVELQLGSPRDVVRLDVRWSAPGSDDDITTTSLRFSPGQAPSSIRTNVRLPDGAYDVSITVERVSGVDAPRPPRRIALEDASRVTIPLR
jgi:hypothetical protein